MKLLSEEPIEVRKDVSILFSLDPENNFVEFVEYRDVTLYSPDLIG